MSLSALDEHPFVPEQLHPAPAAQAERLLVAAVLGRAVLDLRSANRKVRQEAESWVKNDSSEPWGFRWIADVLGLHPDHLRRVCLSPQKSRDNVTDVTTLAPQRFPRHDFGAVTTSAP